MHRATEKYIKVKGEIIALLTRTTEYTAREDLQAIASSIDELYKESIRKDTPQEFITGPSIQEKLNNDAANYKKGL